MQYWYSPAPDSLTHTHTQSSTYAVLEVLIAESSVRANSTVLATLIAVFEFMFELSEQVWVVSHKLRLLFHLDCVWSGNILRNETLFW